ncbi:hypothetical protein T8K17_14445 [Thalassobaculum sp. OXR-137]|uniref:hypothetical protein n=1 Tax=Thalassobaculum sp. OXR-137 TaxID=3100173 RepID=UPI002AC91005|nr:hypothetical protein [Thalassobaculum sp. OXR-137]WPZ32440.1 hypothetical protein T8K17_14445 [Thalassobaculum sp. OXR-137]
MQRPMLLAAAALTGIAAAFSVPASARASAEIAQPPQVLGLVAHATPVPLTCEGGICQALVSSFCLQEHRPPPGDGQVYETAGAGDVTLLVRKSDGSTREFSGAGLLGYVSDGHFTRTRITMDSARLASLDATEVSVRIAPMVSLVPVTDAPLPTEIAQRDAETAYGEPRFTASDFFHPGKTRPDAAVTLTRMINALPTAMSGGVDPRAVDPFKRAALWSSVAESGALAGLSSDGIARAKGELDRCGQYAEMGFKLTLRGCLESAHDRTMREVNDELWKAEVGY